MTSLFENYEEFLERRSVAMKVNQLIEEFSSYERTYLIVQYHYFEGYTLEELSQLYGISTCRVLDILRTFKRRFMLRYPYMGALYG